MRERNLKEAGLYRWESFKDCGEMWGKQALAHDRFLTRMCHQRAAGKCSEQAEAQGAGRIFKKRTDDISMVGPVYGKPPAWYDTRHGSITQLGVCVNTCIPNYLRGAQLQIVLALGISFGTP